MATVQHSTLSSSELHEPKGAATADANTVYVADGAGSGEWRTAPVGFCTYHATTTGLTLTAPQTFTLSNVPSQQFGVQKNFTNNGAGRLTYTGALTTSIKLQGTITCETKASNVDVVAEIFVNGAPAFPAQFVSSGTVSGSAGNITLPLVGYVSLSTNDYVEIYVQASSGDLEVFAQHLFAEGVI